MSAITLEAIEAKQTELAELIDQWKRSTKREASALTLHIPAADLVLFPDEIYCGEIRGDDGKLQYYLVGVSVRDDTGDWDELMAWAKSLNADLPSPSDAWLLRANAKHWLPDNWIWLNKPEGPSSAWCCGHFGLQDYLGRSARGGGVAVRRVFPSAL